MRKRTVRSTALALLVLATSAGAGRAAVTAAPGYAVRTIPTPGQVQGGVVRRGADVLVGQGPTFTAGAQSIIRFTEGGAATTIATGFNSLGGFDLAADGTLYVVDNGLETGGATGDTLYAIPDALTRTTAVAAADVEVLPEGSIAAPSDVLVVSGGVLVGNATGPGAGTVLRVAGGTATPLISGLDFTAGLALAGSTLLVGNVGGPPAFAASVGRYDLSGTPLGSLTSAALSGSYALAIDGGGNVLVSGGFTDDFLSSTVIAVDATGTKAERARGFEFSTEMFFDAARNETLMLDVDVSQITAICGDSDGDGTCDADEPCVPVAKAKLGVKKLSAPGGDEKFAFKGELTLPATFAPPLDPVAKGVRVRLQTAQAAATEVTIPPGAFDKATKTGWKADKSLSAWTFKSETPVGPLGITKVSVKTSQKTPGMVKFAVAGKEATLAVAQADLPLAATLMFDPAGQCGEATFTEGEATCAFNRKQTGVTCK